MILLLGAVGLRAWAAAPPPVPASRPMLVGVFVNGQDTGSDINLIQGSDHGYEADIDQFAATIKSRVRTTGTTLAIPTPLGDASLPATSIRHRGKARYVPITQLAKALAAIIRFNSGEFALTVKLPWTPDAPSTGQSAAETMSNEKPDIRAPTVSLSAIHSEAYFSRLGGNDSLTTLTDLQGALGPGSWRTHILTSAPGDRQIMQNYGWTLDRGDNRFYLGHSQLALDPLLPYANLTGAQYAWSNRPEISYGEDLSNNQLVATQTLGGQALAGRDGPPGGIAELRINGKVVARTAIRLDGSWEFRDIVLRGTEFAEVALYQRFGDSTPTRVVPVNSATSPRSLPAGTLVSYAGLGADGNPLDPAIGTHGMGGFYQVRWGISDRLTVDASAQHANGRDYGVSNAIVGLGTLGTWGFGVARGGSASAWSVQGSGQHGMWFWNAYARQYGANYFPGVSALQSDRYGEFGAHVTTHLDVSLVGRDATDPFTDQHYRFVKPAVNWAVTDRFSVNARPDYNGSYIYAANWNVRNDTQLMLSRYVGISQLELVHALPNGMQLDLAATHDPLRGMRYSQTVSGLWTHAHPLTWSAGLLEGNRRIGYLLDAAMETLPGLSVHMQLYDDPTSNPGGINNGTTFQLSLVADFAVTSSGLARGNYSARAARRGAISGKVTGQLPDDVKWSDLAGIEVLIDGKPLGTLDGNGHYLVSDLPPGVYQLQMDSEKLPIDLLPPARHPLVEVRAGATTRADFAMLLRLGFAGRITRADGSHPGGIKVVAVDGNGNIVGSSSTDARGYYRIDQLPPGTYTVRAGRAQRTVTLQRAFVYGQDLVVRNGSTPP
ncbi:MAG: MSCRAMM family protein [Rhodanobacter sp.]